MGRMELAGKSRMAWKQAGLTWLLVPTFTEIQEGHYSEQGGGGERRKREIKINVFSFHYTAKMRNTNHFLS